MGLTVFSEAGCEGTGKELKESEVNIAKAGIKFTIKSARVEGNPWILFTEERYQGFLAYLEEGTYNDFTTLGLPSEYKVGSAKYKKESLAFPQIRLFNSSSFRGDPTVGWWTDGDGNGNGTKKMKSLDVGIAGTWAITVDQTVVYRDGTGYGAGSTGTGWSNIMGKMRMLSVGASCVWAVNAADEVFVRVGLSEVDPRGKEWTKIDGNMKSVSVGPSGVCWAVDKKETVWRRLGAKNTSIIGTKWQSVTGRLASISVGQAGVWGISPKNEVMYRDGTFDLPGDAEGSGWTKVDGMMVWIASCSGIVWAVSSNGELWYRAGITQNSPMGTNWFKMDTRPNVEAWKQAVMYEGSLWGIDGTEVVRCKEQATQDQILAGNSITLMEEFANFKSFNIHEKPSSFRVLNGGWVIYEKPNFKGKCLYFYEDDCYSNDPENKKGPKLKTWQDPIGSIRHLHGIDCKSVSVSISIDWTKVTTEHKATVSQTFEGKNTTFEYSPASWQKINEVEAVVRHKLNLFAPVNGLTGASTSLEGVPKQGFTFLENGNKLDTGTDFRQELSSPFTFKDDASSSRERKKAEVVMMPPFIAPKTEVKVEIVVHEGTIKIPFVAHLTSGNSKWEVAGEYTGTDATMIKMELSETSLLEGNRKVSRM